MAGKAQEDKGGMAVQPAPNQGGRWRITVIRGGLSLNGNFYPDAVLSQAAALFDGVRVFIKSDAEHLKGGGKDVRNLIGRLARPQFVAGAAPDTGEIQADLELIQPDSPIAAMVKAAVSRDMTDLFGFSIDAKADVRRINRGGKLVTEASKITSVASVDMIVEPGAGGRVINIIEAKDINTMEFDDTTPLTTREIATIVNASNLPAPAKARLIEAHAAATDTTEASLREAIKDEAEYLGLVVGGGHVVGLGDQRRDSFVIPARSGRGPHTRVTLIESRADKTRDMLDAFFDPTHKDHRQAQSIRECYVQTTGDRTFTGQFRNCDEALMREALGSQSFPEALGDSITRRMINDYKTPTQYDVWRRAVNIVPVSDFRMQERTRIGGYGDLPKVAESDPYVALVSPTDEHATYKVEKRGGTEDVTLEMITNDDVGAVRQIPVKLSRAAKRTLGKFVLDVIKDNPVIYDGVTLFHATHGNLGTAALSGGAVAAGRLAMKAQTEKDSGEKLGIPPKYLWVPDQLEETAVDLFRRNTEQDKTFVQSLTLEVMPVWYWTDANDWALSADPLDVPSIELGFLSGQEEPELFIQDSPHLGSMFSHDKATYKIRHIYGGTVTDYRGWYKGAVA